MAFKRSSVVIVGMSLLAPIAAQAEGMAVAEATYGCLCEPPANCDATKFAKAACDGKTSCSIAIGPAVCGGVDPLPGETKFFVIHYRCGATKPMKDARGSDGQQIGVACR